VALFYKPMVGLFGARYRLFDVGGLIGMAGMVFMLINAIVTHTRTLYREERIP
jgi:hypothetical protein